MLNKVRANASNRRAFNMIAYHECSRTECLFDLYKLLMNGPTHKHRQSLSGQGMIPIVCSDSNRVMRMTSNDKLSILYHKDGRYDLLTQYQTRYEKSKGFV